MTSEDNAGSPMMTVSSPWQLASLTLTVTRLWSRLVCDILRSCTSHRLLAPPISTQLWLNGPMRARGLSSLTSLLHAQPVLNAVQSYARSLYNSFRCKFRHNYIITFHYCLSVFGFSLKKIPCFKNM